MARVRQSTIIPAPVDEVWRVLRDFNGHDRWHPAVAQSRIEGADPVDAVGAVRRFRLADGGEFREQLLSLSDKDRTLSYCLLEAPLPLMGYVAWIRLKPVTDSARTFWEWRSEFEPPAHRRDELVALVTNGIYQAGFAAIRALFGGMREGPRSARNVEVRAPLRAAPAAPTPRVATAGGATSSAVGRARAIVVEEYGGPEVLRLREVEAPPPAPGEVQIRHTFVGVNFIDVYCRTGHFDLLRPPGVPGMEGAGVIAAVGTGVEGFSIGDRVAYACPPVGAYCERRNMSPELMVRLSDDISDEVAAAYLLKGVSASFLLHDVHAVRAGETIVVHAAAGGVGQLLVQWACHLGARVIATVSNDEKARIASRLGAHHVVVYTRENFTDETMRLTSGRGADVIYDAVGADTFAGSLAALAARGHLVSYGEASGAVGNWDLGRFSSKSITVSRPNYAHYADTPDRLGVHVERFFAAVRRGIVSVDAPTRYDLARAADAHRDLEARRTTGSLVLAC